MATRSQKILKKSFKLQNDDYEAMRYEATGRQRKKQRPARSRWRSKFKIMKSCRRPFEGRGLYAAPASACRRPRCGRPAASPPPGTRTPAAVSPWRAAATQAARPAPRPLRERRPDGDPQQRCARRAERACSVSSMPLPLALRIRACQPAPCAALSSVRLRSARNGSVEQRECHGF